MTSNTDAPDPLKALKSGEWPDVAHVESAVIRFPNGVKSGNWQTQPNERTKPYVPQDLANRQQAEAVGAIESVLSAIQDLEERGIDRGYGIDRDWVKSALTPSDATAALERVKREVWDEAIEAAKQGVRTYFMDAGITAKRERSACNEAAKSLDALKKGPTDAQ